MTFKSLEMIFWNSFLDTIIENIIETIGGYPGPKQKFQKKSNGKNNFRF